MTSPADEIRAAATRIREAAQAATPGPWKADTSALSAYAYVEQDRNDGHLVADINGCDDHPGHHEADAEHVALWHPGVASLVADLLDHYAARFEQMEWQNSRPGDGRTRILPNADQINALLLARAVNGQEDNTP